MSSLPRRLAWVLGVAVAATAVVHAPPARAGFPGENGLIAWERVFFFTDSEIWVMNPDGSGKHVLTQNDQNDRFPAWSADGSTVAFESSSDVDLDIWAMDADGSNARNLSNDPSGPDLSPAWSPDGTQLAFWKQNFDGTGSIWVMDADGSNQVELTPETSVYSHPAWSPDGGLIAFVSNRSGGNELYVMRPDGSGKRRLTFTVNSQEDHPNWSPDGTMLAFEACQDDSWPCVGSANTEIFVVRRDGTFRRRLTNHSTIDGNPAWSPDGTEIVFRSDRAENGTQLWKMDADGTDLVQLTFADAQGGVDPDWQPIV